MRTQTLDRTARRLAGLAVVTLAVLGGTSCGHLNTEGKSPSYLIIDQLNAAAGAKPDEMTTVLRSDVLTYVKKKIGEDTVLVPTVFEDNGQVVLRAALKDQGTSNSAAMPTPVNAITVTRYRVVYKRTDGRNTEGVDVPYAFDGAATATIDSTGGALVFSIVRLQAKIEAPLKALVENGGSQVISTIAEITFYGRDQAGNAVSVTGMISINFADWGDPE